MRSKHYNYFRDYDPSIGRYVESDPIGVHGLLTRRGVLFDVGRYQAIATLDPDGAAEHKHTFDPVFSFDTAKFDSASSINTFGYVDGNPLYRLDSRGEGWAAVIVIGGAIAVGGAVALGTYFEVKCLKKCNQFVGCPYKDDDEHIQERHLWWTKCRNTCSKSIIELFHSGGVGDLAPTRP